jgi:hypothetical protein
MISHLARPLVFSAILAVTVLPARPDTVQNFIDAATRETGVIRKELDKNEKEGKQAAWLEVRTSLTRCQDLIDQLKTASNHEFDPLKAEYEKNRTDLYAKVAVARQAKGA